MQAEGQGERETRGAFSPPSLPPLRFPRALSPRVPRAPLVAFAGSFAYAALCLGLGGHVHLGPVLDGVLEGLGEADRDLLLGLHGGLHDRVVGLEGVDVVALAGEDLAVVLDALAEAVLADRGDDLLAVVLLGVDPAGELVQGERVLGDLRVELVDLHHGLADGGRILHGLGDDAGRIRKEAGGLGKAKRVVVGMMGVEDGARNEETSE